MGFELPLDGAAAYGEEVLDNRNWSLAQSRLFAGASEAMLAAAASAFRFLRLPAGSAVAEPDEGSARIFIVKRGRVWLRRRLNAHVLLPIAILGPGEVGGAETLFEPWPVTAAHCLSDTLLLTSTAAELWPLLRQSAVIAAHLAAILAERLNDTVAMLAGFANERIVGRVHERLIRLRGRYGVVVSDGMLLDIELGSDDIASLIGASPDEVAQALWFLQTARILRRSGTSITLLDAGTTLPPISSG